MLIIMCYRRVMEALKDGELYAPAALRTGLQAGNKRGQGCDTGM